ncbi:MAG: hypothetical protein V1834_03310, partial [Candidatus Micrarchaeota archaeon]
MNPPFELNVPEIIRKHPRAEKLSFLHGIEYDAFKEIGNKIEKETGSVITHAQVTKVLHTIATEAMKKPKLISATEEKKLQLFGAHLKDVVLKQVQRRS